MLIVVVCQHSIANSTEAPNANVNETAKAVAIFFFTN
jgi:hypothetical protein